MTLFDVHAEIEAAMRSKLLAMYGDVEDTILACLAAGVPASDVRVSPPTMVVRGDGHVRFTQRVWFE